MEDLKQKMPQQPCFCRSILASGEGATFGSRIPVRKPLEKQWADTEAARGVWVHLGGEQEDLPGMAT